MKPQITAAWRGGDAAQRPGWHIAFTYHEPTIAALKAAIPASERAWNPETKTWFVTEAYADAAVLVLPGLKAFRAQIALF